MEDQSERSLRRRRPQKKTRVAKTGPEFRRDGVGGQEGSRKVQRRGNGQWEAGRKAALSAVSSQRERERSVTAGR